MRVLLTSLLVVFGAGACTSAPTPPAQASADPMAEAAENVRLVGYHDLQGRESLMVVAKSDPANGNWLYVGHHESYWDGEPKLNPLTNQKEWNGTSILEISDPTRPRLVWHIPNQVNANSRAVSVVYDLAGRDYLIRNMEAGDDLRFQIFDITTRDTDPSKIALVAEITGTPPDSCGRGCGGKFTSRAHKGWWSQRTKLFYSAAGEPGFRSAIIQVWDLNDPQHPKFVSRMWIPGQKDGEPGFEGQYAHHPIVDEPNKRLYAGFRNAGHAAAWDISDLARPKLLWVVDTNPPGRGPHTVSPIVYQEVPNFPKDSLPRTYAFVVDEAGGDDDMMPCSGPRSKAYMFDITVETRPFPISTWQVPVGNFCQKGGRFGPHQPAETVNGDLNRFEDKLAWVAYFNAGVRVVDLADPYSPRERGFYIPRTNERSHPIAKGQPTVIQINDVDLDHRGLAYATDRVGTGLFVLEYTGPRAARPSATTQ
jgi:hypothetical protein